MTKIDVEIGEVVVRGLAVENPAAFAEALRGELARSLTEGGIPANIRQSGSVAMLRARPIAKARTDGRGLGGQVAGAIFGALGR